MLSASASETVVLDMANVSEHDGSKYNSTTYDPGFNGVTKLVVDNFTFNFASNTSNNAYKTGYYPDYKTGPNTPCPIVTLYHSNGVYQIVKLTAPEGVKMEKVVLNAYQADTNAITFSEITSGTVVKGSDNKTITWTAADSEGVNSFSFKMQMGGVVMGGTFGLKTADVTYNGTLPVSGPKVDKSMKWTVDPAEGMVSSLKDFTVAFPDYASVVKNDDASITLKNKKTGATSTPASVTATTATVGGKQVAALKISLSAAVTAEAVYDLTISEGSLTLTAADGSQALSPAIAASWSVEAKVELPSSRQYMSYSIPSAEVCSPKNATLMGCSGLGVVLIGLSDKNVDINMSCTGSFVLKRDGVVVTSFKANSGQAMCIPAGTFVDDDGLPDQNAINDLFLVFDPAFQDTYSYASEFTQDGTYEVIIPDGALKLGSELLAGTTIKYVYSVSSAVNYDYTVAPAAPVYPSDLAKVTITFPSDKYLMYYGDADNYKLTCGSTTYKAKSVGGFMGSALTLTFDASALANAPAGTYTLNIPKGYLNLNDPYFEGFDEGLENGNVQEINLSFTVKQKMPESRQYLSYAIPDAEACNPSTAVLMGNVGMGLIAIGLDNTSVALNSACTGDFVMKRDGVVISSFKVSTMISSSLVQLMPTGYLEDYSGSSPMALFFVFDPDNSGTEFTKFGTYEVIIPDDALKLGSTLLAGTTFKYVYSSGAPEPALELKDHISMNMPANAKGDGYHEDCFMGVIALNLHSDVVLNRACTGKVQLLFNNKVLKELSPANEEHIVHAKTRSAEPVATVTFNFAKKGDDVEAYRNAGDYKLVIPDGLFTQNGKAVNGTSVDYAIDVVLSVNALGAEVKTLNVVSLDGRLVLKNASASELNSLDKGIYIINGKKVLVK